MAFDINSFMQTEVQGSNETSYTPIPEGEYIGVIKELKGDMVKESPVIRVTYVIDSEEARQASGQQEPTVEQTLWLDLTATGSLDFGSNRNVQLGRLREAVGQNDPNQGWSPTMLQGQVVLLSISHRMNSETGDRFAQVKRVTARP